jgi:MFS family permease
VPDEQRSAQGSGLPRWAKRTLVSVALAGLFVVGVLVGAAFLPRWWAHRIGAQAGGNFTAGIALGLFYGFVFTLLPYGVLRWAFDRRRPFRTWAMATGIAGLLASPNLLTLGIVIGSSKATHAGERTLDVEAPGFRASTLIGAIAAVLAALAVEFLVTSRRRAKRRLESLRAELSQPQADAEPPQT